MNALDLFCGAGGASLGLERAGYKVLGLDKWDIAVQTHRANAMPAQQRDLNDVDWSEYQPVDLVWASPPCQPFSVAGRNAGEWDARDGFPAYLRALAHLRPRLTIAENVQGLTFKKNRDYLERVVKEVEALGYTVEWKVLNCADFGLPQTRKRWFLVGRLDSLPVWPPQTHASRWVPMSAALGLTTGAVVSNYGSGGDSTRRGVRRANQPSATITSKAGRNLVVPLWPFAKDSVHLTIEEAKVLQGFPSDFVLTGTKTAQFLQVGNAVPPLMATLLAKANL